jgi:hypothetical protein
MVSSSISQDSGAVAICLCVVCIYIQQSPSTMQALLQRAVPCLTKYGCVAFDMDYTLARCRMHVPLFLPALDLW